MQHSSNNIASLVDGSNFWLNALAELCLQKGNEQCTGERALCKVMVMRFEIDACTDFIPRGKSEWT